MERRAGCQRFNLKREELLAVINVSYEERKSRRRKFSFHNSTATSHIKRRSYKQKRGGGGARKPKTENKISGYPKKDQDKRIL